MTRKRNNKRKKNKGTGDIRLDSAPVIVGIAMAPAPELAAERKHEATYNRAIVELRARGLSCDGSSDSCSSEGDPLRPPPLPAPRAARAPPPTAALLTSLGDALRAAHPRHVAFLDHYRQLLDGRSDADVQLITEQLAGGVEEALAAGRAPAGGAVLAAWLGAATAWHGRRVPGAVRALRGLLWLLTPHQVVEVARALHAALGARELIAVSDAVRGVVAAGVQGGGAGLAALLLRGALGRVVGEEPAWAAGALGVGELRAGLVPRWGALDAAAQLMALALLGRALAGTRGEAVQLLRALGPPPPPKDTHDPEYLKVCVAVKTLQNLLKATR